MFLDILIDYPDMFVFFYEAFLIRYGESGKRDNQRQIIFNYKDKIICISHNIVQKHATISYYLIINQNCWLAKS